MKSISKSLLLYFVGALSLLCSLHLSAEPALSKSLIEQHAQTIEKLEAYIDPYPEFDDKLTNAMAKGKTPMVSLLKTLPTFPKIKSTIKASGFSNVEQFVSVGLRIMGATVSAQMSEMPNGMTADSFIAQMKNQMKAMEQQGIPKEMLEQMKARLTRQLDNIKKMQGMSKYATAADIKFVSENLTWVSQIMDTESK